MHELKNEELERGDGFGRIAFSVPTNLLPSIENQMRIINPQFIQNGLMRLDTPGKPTVEVVIANDPV